jgi:hypothetical protein
VLSTCLEFAAPQLREADLYLPAIARVQLVTRMLDEQKMADVDVYRDRAS